MTEVELIKVLHDTLLTGTGDTGKGAVPVSLPTQASSMNGLKEVISTAIREAKERQSANPSKAEKEKIDNQKQLNTETKKTTEEVKKLGQSASGASKSIEDIQNNVDKSDKIVNKFGVSAAQVTRILDSLSTAFNVLRNTIGREAEQRYNWMQQLDDAGIRLSKGFDNSFTELSNQAKLSHDQYAKFLVSNSQVLHKLTGTLSDSEEKISTAMGNLSGKYGLSANQIQAGMSGYINNVLKYRNGDMTQEQINTESERYIKNLKELSLATGKTVEQLEKEAELKENSLWAKRTMMDPKLSGMYKTLKSLGLNDTQIKGMMTGVPNDETIKMGIDPNMRRLMATVQRDTKMLNAGMNVDYIGNIGNEIKRGKASVNNRWIDNMDYSTTAAIGGSALDSAGATALGVYNSSFNVDNARAAVSGENEDTGILNRINSFLGIKNVNANNANKTLSPSMKTLSYLAQIAGGVMTIIPILTLIKAKEYGGILGPYAKKMLKSLSDKFSGLSTSPFANNIMGQMKDTPMFKMMDWAGQKVKGFGQSILDVTSKVLQKPQVTKALGWMKNMGGKAMQFIGKNFVKMLGGAFGGMAGASLGGWLSEKIKEPLGTLFGNLFGGDGWFKKGSLSGNILQLIMKTAGGALGGFLMGNIPGAIIGGAWGLLQGIMGWESAPKAESSRLLAQDQGINGLSQETLDIISGYNPTKNAIFTKNDLQTKELGRIANACERTAGNTNSMPETASYNRSQDLWKSTYGATA